jgi:mannose-1-phosphate guanylyltransferase/phosphomannomutase
MKTSKAIILAGGKGSRVYPITTNLPKPLIPINGEPIIKLQIEQLCRLGIEEVFILTGYLGETVERYIENNRWNIRIRIIHSPVEFSPAERILNCIDSVGENFLLLYCDNYSSSDQEVSEVLENQSRITFLIEPRPLGNIGIDSHGRAKYFSGERKNYYNYVELGYISIKTIKFQQTLSKLRDLTRCLELFSHQYTCKAVISKSKVFSISNLDRFIEISKRNKVIILDRDGVLLEKMPSKKYLSNATDYKPMLANWDVLQKLSQKGVYFIVATNQPGIATGDFNEKFLNQIHAKLTSDLLNFGVYLIAFYVCTHHWDDNCICRKPKPGMLRKALIDFRIENNDTVYIGDEEKDRIAANSAGIKSIIISPRRPGSLDFRDLNDAESTINQYLHL